MRVALIDLGTNSVRLHIFERDEEENTGFRRVFQTKEMIQLGVGLFASGDITEAAQLRARETFREFRTILDRYEVSQVEAVATCAMREAKSGAALQAQITEETGIHLRIISGEEEARLIARGLLFRGEQLTECSLLVDIGGGSTELCYVNEQEVIRAVSTPLGAVRCQEMTLCTLPASREREEALRAEVRHELHRALPEKERCPATEIVGSSGSIRALLRLAADSSFLTRFQEIPTSPPPTDRDSQTSCRTEELSTLVEVLRGRTTEELLAYTDLEEKRARIIFAAAVILHEIAKELHIPQIIASPYGLKDGLFALLVER